MAAPPAPRGRGRRRSRELPPRHRHRLDARPSEATSAAPPSSARAPSSTPSRAPQRSHHRRRRRRRSPPASRRRTRARTPPARTARAPPRSPRRPRDARAARARRYLPALSATNFATAVICASLSLPLNAGMTRRRPRPGAATIDCEASAGRGSARPFRSRPPPSACGSSRSCAWKIALPSVPRCGGGFAFARRTRDRRDVGRDVLRVLALDEVLRHRRRRLADLRRTTFWIVLCLKPCLLSARERVVEVRADRPRRARGREHVAAARTSPGRASARSSDRPGATPCRRCRSRHSRTTSAIPMSSSRTPHYAGGCCPSFPASRPLRRASDRS